MLGSTITGWILTAMLLTCYLFPTERTKLADALGSVIEGDVAMVAVTVRQCGSGVASIHKNVIYISLLLTVKAKYKGLIFWPKTTIF